MIHDSVLFTPVIPVVPLPLWPRLPLLCRQTYSPADTNLPAPPTGSADVDIGGDADAIQNELLQRLREMSVSGYEQLIALLLQAIGYNHVQVLRSPNLTLSTLHAPKLRRRSRKGRNRHGGVDIIATGRAGLASGAVLVQVKQYVRSVSRRFVDELRGALLRREARHGLLFTTSHFASAALEAAQEDHIAPVYLIDGDMLCRLLVTHGIGVKAERKTNEETIFRIDESFFDGLESD